MPHIPALQKPSYDALGHHVEQRLSGSVDYKAAQTRDSRLINFLTYIDEYGVTDKYLNHSSSVVGNLLSRCPPVVHGLWLHASPHKIRDNPRLLDGDQCPLC